MNELYELKEKLMKELKDYSGNGKFSKDDVESIKYITSAIDHICNIVEGEEEYSGMYPYAYDDGMNRGSYRGSYARGRNARRDSMGRYSSEGYSRHSLGDKLRELMEDAPDERTRMEIKRLADSM